MPRGEENEIFIRTDDMEANQAIQQRIKATICHCGKICKNIHGLKIHQARMKCQVETSQGQRTGASPGETQETQGREAHHSAQSLQAEAQVPPKTLNTAGNKIKWPAAADKKALNDFNWDICEILTVSAKGAVDKRLLKTSKIIVSYAADRYGYEEKKEKVCGRENRRGVKIKQCRRELKALTKRHKTAEPEEKNHSSNSVTR